MNHLAKKAKKLFVDSLVIRARGGTGGHGLPQYGGIGGKGGDVYIRGSKRSVTLQSVLKMKPDGVYQAGNGEAARRTRLLGESGRDLYINVPIGVSVEDSEKQLLGDINKHGDSIIVAAGGRGGDKFNDNHGFPGQKRVLRLDMKMISDAVLVGFPNAGKSSLLRAVSRATPKVASYPFTTLKPNLGIINYSDYRSISMADLPGLVEGAHNNIGLGHEFLKHIVRTKLLVFLVDINGVDLGPGYNIRSPIESLCVLNKEIELYDDTILNKPAILAITKMDTLKDSKERFGEIRKKLEVMREKPESADFIDSTLRPSRMIQFEEVVSISSESGHNIEKFVKIIRDVIDEHAEMEKSKIDNFKTFRELQPLENNRILQ